MLRVAMGRGTQRVRGIAPDVLNVAGYEILTERQPKKEKKKKKGGVILGQ
jgi:hypothetical protein